jgi:hypothetical protein
MTYLYRFRMLKEKNPLDGREFPGDLACLETMNTVFNEDPSDIETFDAGEWVLREVTAEEIARFHHVRRAYGACARIKWELLG